MPPDQVATQDAPAAPESAPKAKSMSQIASEMFGDQFKGKVEEAKPVEIEEPKPDDAQKGEVPIEEPTESSPHESVEPEEGEGEPAPAQDTGEMPIATVSELVEHLEADPSWFNGLKMSFNVDGMPTEATIAELVDAYQLEGAARHRLETAKEIAQKEQEVWAQKQQAINAQFEVQGNLIKQAEAYLERDIKSIDPKLRDEDPAEWAARIQEFNQRRFDIHRMKTEGWENYKAVAQTRAAEADEITNRFRAEQEHMLLEKLPEWRDPQRAATEKMGIAEYALNQGYTQEELANLLDHRHVLVLRKARLYDESRGQVDTAKKRVAKVPKVMKPGAPKAREQIASERLGLLRAKMEKSGKEEDVLAYTLAKRRGVST